MVNRCPVTTSVLVISSYLQITSLNLQKFRRKKKQTQNLLLIIYEYKYREAANLAQNGEKKYSLYNLGSKTYTELYRKENKSYDSMSFVSSS